MKRFTAFLTSTLLLLSIALKSQSLYQIYNQNGEKVNTSEMLSELSAKKLVFFGELHNNPIAHWLELEILKHLDSTNADLKLGMEMFERDQQLVLEELSKGLFPPDKLKDYTRLWPNYSTDYQPLVKYCVKYDLPIIATNIPRRYASLVYKKGFSHLQSDDIPENLITREVPEIDSSWASYASLIEMGKEMGHSSENFVLAQAVKDVVMAESIASRLTSTTTFFHINGAFHSKNREGIVGYLLKMNPELSIATIQCQEVVNPDQFKQQTDNFASFHILINKNLTHSYE